MQKFLPFRLVTAGGQEWLRFPQIVADEV